jgi:hypothetical protein
VPYLTEQISGQLTQKELRELRRLKVVREALDELKKKGVSADIAICPNCKSFRVIQLTSSHDLGFFGNFQPAFYCLDCGWYGRKLTIMSNRPESDAVPEDLQTAFAPMLEENEDASYEADEI